MNKRYLAVIAFCCLVLGGCTATIQPPSTPQGITITANVSTQNMCVTVSGTVSGGTPPYTISHDCSGGITCSPGCPCPAELDILSCPQGGCRFQFKCCYVEPGEYKIIVFVKDKSNNLAWKEFPVTVTITEFTIEAKAGPGGSISPSGFVKVVQGGSKTFTIRVFEGYTLGDVLVDGVSVLGDLSDTAPAQSSSSVWYYTFHNVQANHKIEALFGTDMPPGPPVE